MSLKVEFSCPYGLKWKDIGSDNLFDFGDPMWPNGDFYLMTLKMESVSMVLDTTLNIDI